MDPFLPRTFIIPGRLIDSFNVFKALFSSTRTPARNGYRRDGVQGETLAKTIGRMGPHRLGGVTRG